MVVSPHRSFFFQCVHKLNIEIYDEYKNIIQKGSECSGLCSIFCLDFLFCIFPVLLFRFYCFVLMFSFFVCAANVLILWSVGICMCLIQLVIIQ